MGAHEYGAFAAAWSLVAVVSVVADAGLGTLLVRDLTQSSSRELDATTYRDGFRLRVALMMASAVLSLAAGWLIYGDPLIRLMVAVLVVSTCFGSLQTHFGAHFRARETMWPLALTAVVRSVVTLAVGLGCLLLLGNARNLPPGLANPIMALPVSMVIGNAVGCCMLAWLIRRDLELVVGIGASSGMRDMLARLVPFAFNYFFMVAYFRIDAIMIASMVGDEAVGIYDAAYKLVDIAVLASGVVSHAAYPSLSRLYVSSCPRFTRAAILLIRYMGFLGGGLAALVVPASNWLIPTLYGQSFAAGGPVLAVLFVGVAIMWINGPLGYLMTIFGRQGVLARLTIANTLVVVALNAIALAPWGLNLGPLGSATITTIAEGIGITWLLISLRDKLELCGSLLRRTAAVVLALGAATAAALGAGVLVGGSLLVSVVSVITYSSVVVVLRGLDMADLGAALTLGRQLFSPLARLTSQSEINVTSDRT